MTNVGKIKSYDSAKGAGMITPEKGGEALPFNKADLQQQAQEPRADQRFEYETRQGDGGKEHATNLQMEQGTNNESSNEHRSSDNDSNDRNANDRDSNNRGLNQQS